MKRDIVKAKAALLSSCALAVSGCMSIAAIEPVKNPPVNYQADVAVQVEFLHPARVGTRCAERGVSIFGLPAPGAMACANQKLMTIPNPCDTVTGGWYAEAVCAEIAHTRGWEPAAPKGKSFLMNADWLPDQTFGLRAQPEGAYRDATAMRVEFVDSQEIGLRCAERGAVAFGKPTLNALSCSNAAMMTLPNPCSVVDGGWYADLLCHEMGHANGWPESHPGGSFLKDGKVPGSHTLPDDDGGFLINFIASVQTATVNARRGDPVKATILASLADDQVMAEQIALKSGIRQLPDLAVPRIDQIPEFALARLVLPTQPASLRKGRDFSKPMGPFAKQETGTRLTRARIESLLNGKPELGLDTNVPAGLTHAVARVETKAPGEAQTQIAYAPSLSADINTRSFRQRQTLTVSAHHRALLALSGIVPQAQMPAGHELPVPVEAAAPVTGMASLPAPPQLSAGFGPVYDGPAGWNGPRAMILDRFLPLAPEN